MSFLRGSIYQPAQERPGTSGFVVLTNDRWNQVMSRIGVVPIRTNVEGFDGPYSVALDRKEGHVVASRPIAPSIVEEEPLLGGAVGTLDPQTLAKVEDVLCAFLQIPQLLRPAPRIVPPRGDATQYAVWGGIYRAGPILDGERKRRIVVSPNAWNAVSGMATFVRTTTSFGRGGDELPPVQRGRARACCGEATTFALTSVLLKERDRPTPAVTQMPDMIAIARGLIITHELQAAVDRIRG